jgi:protein-disulfide isomerase
MASGKASRRRRAAEHARAQQVATKPRVSRAVLWGAVAGALALALVVSVGIGLARSDEKEPGASAGATLPGAADATAAVARIPQRGLVLGKADAPVTLVEFIDLQCPFCRDFTVEALPTVIERHVRTGNVRLEVRGLAFLGPDSERGMRAAFAAARQNRMYELIELLYYQQGAENSGWLTQDLVEAAARSLPGIDVARLAQDMDSGAISDLLSRHADEAERRGVDGTPTIFVGPTGGELTRVELAGATDVEALEQAIAAAQ